jgi:starch phosphorylase
MGQHVAAVGGQADAMFRSRAFNRGDYAAAAEPEALARTISRVLYPDDTTEQGKALRLKQEFFFTAASLHDILRRFESSMTICANCRRRSRSS